MDQILTKTADQIRAYICDQYEYRKDVKGKLRNLEAHLRKVDSAIYRTEGVQIENRSLCGWPSDLKDAVHDAEDVLDKFEYKILQEQAKKQTRLDIASISRNLATQARAEVKKLFFKDEDVNALLDIAERFVVLVNQMADFLTTLRSDEQRSILERTHSELMECRQTSPKLTEPRVFGREEKITSLVKLLKNSGSGGDRNVSVIHISGIGGVGKTTLAKCVYSHNRLSELFNVRGWASVSKKFDVKRITKEIIVSASIERPDDFHSLSNLEAIQKILEEGLEGKRFLIVLDDVWSPNKSKWDSLCTAFHSGGSESKVIVTSRPKKISKFIITEKNIPLGGLDEKAYWRFFKVCAFGDAKLAKKYLELKLIGRDIAEKLSRSPLAAKTVGQVLQANLDVNHWKNILNRKLSELDHGVDGILPVLRMTYDHLLSHLKRCFVFCSLFPLNHVFEKDTLVRMWMAHGLIRQDGITNLEDKGRGYFEDLLQTFFFQHARKEENGDHRLWFKTNLKLCKIWFDMGEYGRMNKILKELHKYCQKEDGTNDQKKGTQLLEVYQLRFRCTLRQVITRNSRWIY